MVVLMCIIFGFSAKTAVESDESSLQITDAIVNTYENFFHKIIDIGDKETLILQVNHIVRKISHGLEYGVLAVLVSFHLWVWSIKKRKLFIGAILISGIYAMTDEFHQLFVAGRSGQITDVMIDTTGAVIGATCFVIILILEKRKI